MRLPGIDDGKVAQLDAPAGIVSASVTGVVDADSEAQEKTEASKGGPDVVIRARNRFEYVESVDSENVANQRDDTRFAWERGAQWNEDNRRARENAKPPRPWLEFNQTGPFVKRITNEQRKTQPSIKVRPAGGGAIQKTADIMSGLCRAIEQDSQASAAYATGLEHAATGGRGYWRLATDWEAEDSFNQVIKIMSLPNPAAVRLDPDAAAPDKSDAKYGFICDWLDEETYEREWPNAGQAVSWDSEEVAGGEWAAWYSANKVCVADYFEVIEYDDELCALDNQMTMWRGQYDEMTKALLGTMQPAMEGAMAMAGPPGLPQIPQVLRQETRRRKRVDWYKVTARDEPLAKYEWRGHFVPIVCCVGDEIMIDGKRIYQGVIRRMRDAQMMLNYAFTMMVERVALAPRAPFIGAAGAFENHPEWETLNTENHPYLEYNIVTTAEGQPTPPPSRNDPIGVDQGLVTMLQLCVQNLQAITGQHDQQAPDPDTPWRALVQSERKGDVATFQYGDNQARAIELTGRMIIDLVPWIYSSQRALRIVNLDGTDEQVTVNQPMPGADLNAPPQTVNNLTVGRYDVAVETGPSYATRRVEAASEMNEFMQTMGPQTAPLLGDLFAKMADWPGDLGDRVAARLHAMLPPQILAAEADPNADPEKQQMQQQLQNLQQQMQGMMQSAQAAIQQRDEMIAQLKTKNESKRLDFIKGIAENESKREDVNTTRLMAAENNASQEYIEKLNLVGNLAGAIAKLGYDPMPMMAQLFQTVAAGGQSVRRGPDFSDVANALEASSRAGDQQVMQALSMSTIAQPDPSNMAPSAPPPQSGGMMPPQNPPASPPPPGMPPQGGNPQ